jgi:hypothetical protein
MPEPIDGGRTRGRRDPTVEHLSDGCQQRQITVTESARRNTCQSFRRFHGSLGVGSSNVSCHADG